MKLTLTLLLLACTLNSLAATFTVTPNADGGPGRTITLASALPNLPANLTIDGTTHPGTPFGISAACIIITDIAPTGRFYDFNIVAVNNVQLYGLFLQSISNYYGIYIQQSNNVYIGAAGKGNILQGFAPAIEATNLSEEPFTTDNIVIQGNILKTDESGTSASTAQLNVIAIATENVTNLQIGGLNPGEGNLMNQTNLPLEYTLIDAQNYGYLNIQGNKIGTDITGNTSLSHNNGPFLIGGNLITQQTFVVVNIINNVSVGGYELAYTYSPFTMQGNHIGVGLDNVTNLISEGTVSNGIDVSLNGCGKGLVGGSGPGQKNYIANDVYGLGTENCGPVTISQNSFFCNGTGIILDDPNYPHPIPYVNITLLTAGTVGGTSLANSHH